MFKELGSMMSLLGNKGKIQEEMQKFQESIGKITAEAASGGGLVTAKVSGRMELLGVKLSDAAMQLNDREMLEDLIVSAVNAAMAKCREQVAAETAKMAGSLGLPPSMLGGLGG
ncbi:MAG: YbaB/EbfC family nucleoid-associated protein [Gemmataceae bacterium]|nr:YbaB/EbfC family nucleoid-associated protein [Gemmataceae bacterium]